MLVISLLSVLFRSRKIPLSAGTAFSPPPPVQTFPVLPRSMRVPRLGDPQNSSGESMRSAVATVVDHRPRKGKRAPTEFLTSVQSHMTQMSEGSSVLRESLVLFLSVVAIEWAKIEWPRSREL